MIRRFSSRRTPLDDFLPQSLEGAVAYDRIAGFFSSSILELAGEAIERMDGVTRMVCNSRLDPLDVQSARAARLAMKREWCETVPEDAGRPFHARLARLHEFLISQKLKVKVLPDRRFGLIHGKAGVVTRRDGTRICFMGSANESRFRRSDRLSVHWNVCQAITAGR